MWRTSVRIKHDCTIANRCRKFGCSSSSLGLSSWHDHLYEYTAQKHDIFGPKLNVRRFIQDLKNDTRVLNIKTLGSQVHFIERRQKKEVPSSYYQSSMQYLKPVMVGKDGWETWELASRNKKELQSFVQGIQGIQNAIVEVEQFEPYVNKVALRSVNDAHAIIQRTVGDLDIRLTEQMRTGHIEGDQWFRDFQDWFMIAFNNPYNYKHANSELILLDRHRKEIFPYIKDHLQIHYGAGVGETELELVMWQLQQRTRTEVCAIDINGVFLELFRQNLKDKQIEFPDKSLQFCAYNTTFQNTTHEDFTFSNGCLQKRVHICLGGTIGNFREQSEIWSVFQRNTQRGDKLLLGFQLNTHIDVAIKKYRTNKFYPHFVLNYMEEEVQSQGIAWELHNGFVTMRYKGLEVFRTRKYSIDALIQELSAYDFQFCAKWIDDFENSCVAIFQKVA